jgi:mRNA interferase MazF
MTRGEVWWADLPGQGRRPIIVLTRDTAIPILESVVVALVTTNVRGIPTEVVIDVDDGIPRRSAISLDNIHTISKRRFVSLIAKLSDDRTRELCEALRFATAC